MRNPAAIHPATLPNRKSSCQIGAEEQAARQGSVAAKLQILCALLPRMFARFAEVKDPRRPGSTRHKGAADVRRVDGALSDRFTTSGASAVDSGRSSGGICARFSLRSDTVPHASP